MYTCGILTVSDSCFYDNAENVSGQALINQFCLLKNFNINDTKTVPDEMDKIQEILLQWTDEKHLNLIVTTGGTGFTPRDVTPEATNNVIEKSAASISQMLLFKSLEVTKFSVLSRGVSGIRKSSLIINFPGSPKAVKECFSFVAPILPHAIDQIINKTAVVKAEHLGMTLNSFSPLSTVSETVTTRARSSTFPLLSVEEAKEIVWLQASVLSTVTVDISESLNMVTSTAVKSRVNVPPFRASIKDGYAVRFSDKAGPRDVISVSNAGDVTSEINVVSGTCARISTGAKVPTGSDAVVQVEDTELIGHNVENDTETVVNIKVAPKEIGQDIRPIGNDLHIDEVLVTSGTLISAVDIGLMAMGGVSKIECVRRPVVGVLSTGNELASYSNYTEGQIIDSNRPLLISLYRSYNFQVKDFGIVRDEPQALFEQLLRALASCDVLVTTGGVSMGEKDYLKSVLCQDLKAKIHFGRIFMKPGKPMTFSTVCSEYFHNNIKLIFSLPGNPVSAYVTSYLFVIPTLKKMSGIKKFEGVLIEAKLQHDIQLDCRPEYCRCKINSIPSSNGSVLYEVSSKEFGNQMSSRLTSCVAADGLICLPPSSKTCCNLPLGHVVTVMKF